MSEQHVLVHRGCQLAYRISGDGPPALFIQGVNTHGDGWLPQVQDLKHRFTCLTFDNRGMGNSERGADKISVDRMADDARAIMAAVGWESAHLVGHSLGGGIALQLALTARAAVRSLSLLCTFADGRRVGPLSWRLISAGLRLQWGSRGMRRRAFLELVMPRGYQEAPETLAARLAPLFGHDLADQPAVVKNQMRALRAFNVTGRLEELAGLPTLVVSAAHDPIAPPSLGEAIADGIPGARFLNLDGASHGVTLTEPARVNALLASHFAAAEAERSCGP